jgi:AcrR family transcriptional regulator
MVARTSGNASPRERLLAAADELFYEEGVHTVGIDRVIERAGVAKASLYSAFGSKEELVRAYLEKRHEERTKRMLEGLAKYRTARDRILGVFEVVAERFAEPGFRGCAFNRASAEAKRDSAIQAVCDQTRGWNRSLFTRLAADLPAPDPDSLATELCLLYDGAVMGAQMDRSPAAATTARAIAEKLIDAAMKPNREKRRTARR